MTQQKVIVSSTGEPMLSAKNAAKHLSCTQDYISKLCREGKLRGVQIQGAWFVERSSLKEFEVTREQARVERSEGLARLRREENQVYRQENVAPSSSSKGFFTTNGLMGRGALVALAAVFLFGAIAFAGGAPRLEKNTQLSAALAQVESPFFTSFSKVFAAIGSLFAPNNNPQPVAQSNTPAPAPQSIVNNYTTNNTTNNYTNNNSYKTTNSYDSSISDAVGQSEFDSKINGLRQEIFSSINNAQGPYSSGGPTNNIALTQRIDHLDGVTISNATIHSLSGLTDADIPDTITVSNYLPLTGGTINGNLTITGTCTGCGGGGGTDTNWSAFSNNTGVRLATTTNQVLIGAASTSTTSRLEVAGGATFDQATSSSFFTTTSSSTNSYSTTATIATANIGMASTSQLYGANLSVCDSGNVLTWNNGLFGCAVDQTATGQANPFTWSSSYGVIAAATTSAISISGGVFASSTSHFADVDFVNATATSLYIGNLTGLLKATNGLVSTAVAGSDYATLSQISAAFPFTPSFNFGVGVNSTSTTINFTNGIFASSTSRFTTVSASDIFTSSATAANIFPYASSTALTISGTGFFGTATTSNFFGAGLNTCNAGNVLTWNNGLFSCTADQVGSTASFPFTPGTNFGVGVNSTSSIINFTSGLFASSTSQFTAINSGSLTTGSLTLGAVNGLLTATNGVVSTVATSSLGLLASTSIQAQSPLSFNVSTGFFSISQSGTGANGYLSSVDFNTFNNKISSTSLSALYPIQYDSSTGVFNLGFGTTTANTWSALQSFASLSATNASFTNATTSSLYIGSLNGPLQANAGLVSATSSVGVLYGGTGLTTAPSYGNILVGNSSGGYTLTATSSLGISTLSSLSATYPIQYNSSTGVFNLGFGTTTANTWSAQQTFSSLFATNASTTNATTSSLYISSLTGPLQAINGLVSASSTISQAFGGTGLTSYASGDLLYADTAGQLTKLPVGSVGQVLKISAGLPSWGADQTASGGGAGAWATTTDSLAIYPSNTSNVIIIGNSATSTLNSIFEVVGRSYFSSNVGIGTTSPSQLLSVQGNGLFSGNVFGANITATGTLTTANLTIGALNGLLTSTNGVVSTIATSTLGLLASSSISATAPLVYTQATGVFSITQSGTGANGYLSSVDFNTFNNKISSTSLSAGAGINYNSTTGVITNTIGYLFPSNATTTTIAFNGGLTTTGATSTGTLAVTGSTTVAGIFNAVGGAQFGTLNASGIITSTATAANIFPYASTTALTVSGNAYFPGSGVWNSSGNVGIGSSTPNRKLVVTGSSVATAPNQGAIEFGFSGTSAALGFGRVLNSVAGSVAYIETYSNVLNSAASLSINPFAGSSNYVAIGTTTAYAALGLRSGGSTSASRAFEVSNSASTTLFIIDNAGNVGIGTTSPTSNLSIHGNSYVSGTSFFGGAITATSTLNVSGLSTLTGFLSSASSSVNGNLSVVGTASTTNLTISSIASGSLLKTTTAGVVTAAIAGTDYVTSSSIFAFPYTPGTNFGVGVNSTTSIINFTNGIFASSTSHFVTADFTNSSSTNATTTNLYISGKITGANLSTCSGTSDKLLWSASTSQFSCGTDAGSTGSTELNWNFFNGSGIRVGTTTNQVLIGASATSSLSKLEVVGGATFDNATTTNGLSVGGVASFVGSIGIGTTSPQEKFTVAGGTILQTASGDPTLATSTYLGSGSQAFATFVLGRYAYVAANGAGLKILDISNPASSTVVGTYAGISAAKSVVVSGNYAFVGDATNGLVIVDVSRPSNPGLVSSIAAGNPLNIALSGRYVIVPDFDTGVVNIVDVANPTAPSIVGSFNTNSSPASVAVSGKYVFVGDAGDGKVYVADISNPTAPQVVTSVAGFTSPAGLYASGRYLYVADVSSGLTVVDISNPAAPVIAGKFVNANGYYSVRVAGDYAYAATNIGDTLEVLDVRTPSQITLIGSLAVGGQARHVFVAGKYAYVAADGTTLKIINISGAKLPSASIGALDSNVINVADQLTVGSDIYVGGGLNVGLSGIFSRGGLAVFGSTTLTDLIVRNSTTTNATTTSIFSTTASSSNLFAGSSVLGNATTSSLYIGSLTGVLKATSGLVSVATPGTDYVSPSGLAAAFPFTTGTNFGVGVNSTTTPIWFKGATGGTYSLMASSTSAFDQIIIGSSTVGTMSTSTAFGNFVISGNASTSNLTVSKTSVFGQGITANSTLNIAGIITSTATAANVLPYASTTALTVSGFTNLANASTTVLSASGSAYFATAGGNVGIGTTTPTSNLSVHGTSYVSGTSFFGGAITATSTLNIAGIITSTATGANVFPYASSTALTVSGTGYFATASTTNLTISSIASGSILKTTTAGAVTAATAGVDYVTGAGLATAFPFSPLTNYAVNTNSTTTPIWFKGATGGTYSLMASSTSVFDQINIGSSTVGTMSTSTAFGNFVISGNASTSNLTVSKTSVFGQGITANSTLNIAGIITSTATGANVFPYASSTALTVSGFTNLANASTTVLSASGSAYFATAGGNVGIGTTSPTSNLSVQGNSYVSGTSFFGGAITATSSIAGLTSASTTALTISGITSGSILKTTTAGAVTAATAGVDYVTGAGLATAFPFSPLTNYAVNSNSTTTPIWFKGATGGTYSLMASSTSVFDQINIGSSTVGTMSTSTAFGNFVISGNASTSNLFVSKTSVFGQGITANSTLNIAGIITSTATAANVLPYASSTALTVSGTGYFATASTTNLTISSIASGSLLKTTTAGAVTAAIAGVDYAAGNVAFPFTPTTNFAATANATGTPIWFQSGIQASSTLQISGIINSVATGANVFPYASTTALTVSGNAYFPGSGIWDSNGNVGIGSSTPNRKLVVSGVSTATGVNQGSVEFGFSGTSVSLGFGRLLNSAAISASYIESYSNTGGGAQPLVLNPFAGTANYVAIGTTTAYAALGLRSGGSTSATRAFEVSNSASTTLLLLDNGGNLGLGTTTPQEKLSITGGSIYQTGGDTVTSYTPKSLGGVDLGLALGQSGGGGQGISVVGNTAYLVTASTTAGATGCSATDASDCEFRIYDVTNPASPVFQGGADLGNIGNGVTVAGHYAYIVNNTVAGTCSATVSTGCDFRIYDIANPSAPVFMGGLDLTTTGFAVVVSGRYAYVTDGAHAGNEFNIIDISNPTNPVVVGGLDLSSSGLGLRVQGNYAYIAHGSVTVGTGYDLTIADISNPTSPVVVGGVDVGSNVRSVYVSGNYMYLGKDNTGITEDFAIYDISNPASPATTTAIDLQLVQSIVVSGRYAYVGLSSATGNDFRIYDVSDPYNMVSVGGVDLGASGQNVFISGRRAYLGLSSVSGNDFRIYDISGAEVQSLVAGSLETGNAQVHNDLIVNGNGNFNALNIDAGGVFSRGGIFSYVASSTATTPVSAAFIGGNVGVGTTSPWANLAIQSTAGTPQFVIGSSTTQFIVDKNGNVGIATTSPWAQFSVTNTGTNPGLVVANSTNSNTQFIVDALGNVGIGTSTPGTILTVASTTPNLRIANTTQSSSYAVGYEAGRLSFYTDDLSGIGAHETGGIYSINETGITTPGGALAFYTSAGGAADTEKLRITESGNVGIGTTSPYAKLSVGGQVVGANFTATTSAVNTFPYASTTALTVSGAASTTALTISGIATGNLLKTTTAGAVTAAVVGVDYAAGNVAFPFTPTAAFGSAANATGTLIGFTGGIYATASSTIGNGSQTGGLTVWGGATTTGSAYFGGNVGIGTTTPQARLGIQGGIGVNATQLYLAANGQVAINTLSPNLRGSLEVHQLSDTSANGIAITNAGVSSEGRMFIDSAGTLNLYGGSAGAGNINLNTTGGVGIGSTTPWANLSIINAGTNPGLAIAASSGATAQFIVDSSGNVGIGTTTPASFFGSQANLAIHSTVIGNSTLTLDGFGKGGASLILNRNSVASWSSLINFGTGGTLDWQLGTNNDSTRNFHIMDGSSNDRLTILNSNGNVGVGTTTPGKNFAVHGTSYFSDTSFFGGAITATSSIAGLTSASTTALTISGITSGSILKTTTAGAVTVATAGVDYVTGAGLATAFPFTPTTNFAATANATGTPIWFQSGIQASSTLQISGIINSVATAANVFPYASTTALTVSGNAYFPGSGIWNSSGNVGIGTTTPLAKINIFGDGGLQSPIFSTLGITAPSFQTRYGQAIQSVTTSGSTNAIGAQVDTVTAAGLNLSAAGLAVSNISSIGTSIGLIVDTVSTGLSLSGGPAVGAYINNVSTNSVGPAYGLRIANVSNASTTNTSNTIAGIQIENSITNSANSANAYALNILSTAKSYFAGSVGIGTTSPQEKLSLTGGNFIQAGGDSTQTYTPTTLGGVDTGIAVGLASIGGSALSVVGNTAYVGTQIVAGTGCSVSDQSGCEFRIYDVSTSTPRFLGGVNLQNGSAADVAAETVTVVGNYAYVGVGSAAGTCSNTSNANGCDFRIFDVSNPTNPVQVGGLDITTVRNIVVSGRYAYITNSSVTGNDFRIIDVSDPTNPVTVGGVDLGQSGDGLYVQGNYAYVAAASSTAGFEVIDISNPASPVTVSTMNLGSTVNTVYVSGNYAYVGKINAGITEDFIVYDISNPAAPATTTAFNVGVAVESIMVSGRYAYVGVGSVSGNDFRIYDISDPYNVFTVGGVDVSTSVYNVAVSGHRAFIGKANAGITNDFIVYDISGAEVQSLLAHSLEAGNATVHNNLIVSGNGAFNALNVGQGGFYSNGPLSVFTGSTTATTPVSASFLGGNVGIGTASPAAKLQIGTTPVVGTNVTFYNGTGLFVNATSTNGGNTLAAPETVLTLAREGVTAQAYANFARFDLSRYENVSTNSRTQLDIRLSNANLNTEANATPVILSLQSGGNVGIGTTSPWAQLSVTNTGTNPGLVVANSTNSSTQFIVDSSGNVGVGTASPNSRLDVTLNDATTNATADILTITKKTTGTAAAGIGANLLFNVQRADGNISNAANISGFLSGVGTGSGTNGVLTFSTSPNSSGLVERLRITSTGNIGVGTTTPTTLLAVHGSSYVSGTSFFGGAITATSSIAGLTSASTTALTISGIATGNLLKTTTAGAVTAATAGVDYVTGAGLATAFPFTPTTNFAATANATGTPIWFQGGLQASSTSYVGSATFLSTGNVGIGTSSPSSLLTVGAGTALSEITVDGGSNGFANAAIVLKAQNGTNQRGGGTYYYDNSGGTEWFTGRPYFGTIGSSDNFVINRQSGLTAHNSNTASVAVATNLFTLTSAGNLGLGTTSPWGLLSINPTSALGTAPAFVIGSSTATKFIVDNGGKVGIGTASPKQTLQVSGNEIVGAFSTYDAPVTTNPYLHIGDFVAGNSTNANGELLLGHVSGSVTGDILGQISFYSSDDSSTATGRQAAIKAITQESVGRSAALAFFTGTGTDDSSLERMRIDASGNIGVGTTTPGKDFAVQGNSYVSGTSFFGGAITATSTLNIAGIITSTATAANVLPFASSTSLTVSGTGFFGKVGVGTTTPWGLLSINPTSALGTAPAFVIGSSTATKFIVDNGGNVGIGNSSPTGLLVVGNTPSYTASNGYTSIRTESTTGKYGLIVESGDASNSVGGLLVYGRGTTQSGDLVHIGSRATSAHNLLNVVSGELADGTTAVSRLIVLASGNVGIGTTTPAQTLAVQGNSYVSGTSFFGGVITATSTLNISGIITSTATGANVFPYASSTALTVSGTGFFGGIGVGTTSLSTNYLQYNAGGTSGFETANLSGIPEAIQLRDPANALAGRGPAVGFYLNNANSKALANIAGLQDDTTIKGVLAFYTLRANVTTEAMRIDGLGNVGIGTSSPWGLLSLNPTSALGSAPAFVIGSTTGTSFIVDNGGKVGIGSTTPQERLSLVGGNFIQAGGDSTQSYTLTTLGGVDLGVNAGLASAGGQTMSVVGNTAYIGIQAVAGTACTVNDPSGCELRIYDVSTSTPRFLGGIDTKNGSAADVAVEGLTTVGNYAYAVLGTATGSCLNTSNANGCDFRIYDISNPTAPKQVGGLDIGTSAFSVVVVGKYAYLTNNSIAGNDFRIIDISDPTNPVTVGGLDLSNSGFGIVVQGNYAYIGSQNTAAGVRIADISDPKNPVTVSTINVGTSASAIYVQGNYLYVGKANAGINEDLMIYDISNPAAPATTTAIDVSVAVQSINVTGRYMYVGTNSSTGNDVKVYDISDPYNIFVTGGVDVGTNVFGVMVAGKRVFVSKANAGITNDFVVYDVSGAEVQSLYAHSLQTDNGSVSGNLIVSGNGALNALNVGQGGLYSNGSLSVFISSTTASNPVSASFMGGSVGVGTTSPWGLLSVNPTSAINLGPAFVIGSSTATNFIVDNVGNVGVATTSPAANFALSVGGSVLIGSGSASVLTLNVGQVNRIAATTTIPNTPNAYSISTSTATGNGPVLSISGNGASSTVSFFGATTTGLTSGSGVALNPTLRNMIIVGDGKTPASIAVVKGSICIDYDGWCSASTTQGVNGQNGGSLTVRQTTTGGSDLAELYVAVDNAQPGDIVSTVGDINVAKATTSASVMGIVSSYPGVVLGLGPDEVVKNGVPIALAGRVPTKVSLQNGPIAVGDRITLSSIPGVGMKARPLDTAVAIALEAYGSQSTSTTILAFISLNKGIDENTLAQFVASSTATTSEAALLAGPFASAAQTLKSALSSALSAIAGIANSGVRQLGLAVYAGLGIFDNVVSQTITATVLNVDQVNAKTLCLDSVCITKTQLQDLLNGSGSGGGNGGGGGGGNSGGGGNGTSTPDTEPPVITLSGNNPATISVGTVYTDLGATVTDNVDNNLGFTVALDGGATTTLDQLGLDTSTSTTHTIVFSATDQAGNTGTATRTVIVE